jgi:hypothetical protein
LADESNWIRIIARLAAISELAPCTPEICLTSRRASMACDGIAAAFDRIKKSDQARQKAPCLFATSRNRSALASVSDKTGRSKTIRGRNFFTHPNPDDILAVAPLRVDGVCGTAHRFFTYSAVLENKKASHFFVCGLGMTPNASPGSFSVIIRHSPIACSIKYVEFLPDFVDLGRCMRGMLIGMAGWVMRGN